MNHTPKLIAFDLDGTLTQHKSKLEDKNRRILERLGEKYDLLMVGAGTCMRIFNQMDGFPINILGCYGMQYAEYDHDRGELIIRRDEHAEVDREEVLRRSALIREKYNLVPFAGETLEIHPTGSLTFPILGTKALLPDKLAYDPDRAKRRVMYPFVKELFFDYNVLIGGTSSFDIVPGRFGKYNALMRLLSERGLEKQDVLYCGDDYLEGGNDHDVYAGGVPFLKVDSYENFAQLIEEAGLL